MHEGISSNLPEKGDKLFDIFKKIYDVVGSDIDFDITDLEEAGIKIKDTDLTKLVESGSLVCEDGTYSINPNSVYAEQLINRDRDYLEDNE